MNRAHNIYLPYTFWNDHAERELPAGELLGRHGPNKTVARVACSEEELAGIYDDAKYYAKDVDGAPGNIIASAKRTVKRIEEYRASEKRRLEMKARYERAGQAEIAKQMTDPDALFDRDDS